MSAGIESEWGIMERYINIDCAWLPSKDSVFSPLVLFFSFRPNLLFYSSQSLMKHGGLLRKWHRSLCDRRISTNAGHISLIIICEMVTQPRVRIFTMELTFYWPVARHLSVAEYSWPNLRWQQTQQNKQMGTHLGTCKRWLKVRRSWTAVCSTSDRMGILVMFPFFLISTSIFSWRRLWWYPF